MTERDKAQPGAESAGLSRRDFVTRTAVAGAGLVIVPRHVLGRGFQAPSDTVNIATVGISGMGSSNTRAVMSQNIVAFCDVDYGLLDARIERWKKAGGCSRDARSSRPRRRRARNRREPTAAQLAANEKRPKINRTENARAVRRPAAAEAPAVPRLPRDARQAEGHRRRSSSRRRITCTRRSRRRRWTSASTSTCRSRCAGRSRKRGTSRRRPRTNPKIVTQMGNQGHSRDEARLGYEYITSGAIGDDPRSARLDEPAARLLAAGRSAPGAAAARLQDPTTAARAGTDRASTRGSRRRWSATIRSADQLVVGSVPRRRAAGRLPPDLSPVQLARLGRLGPGRARRHGRAPHRSSVLVAQARVCRR